MAQAQNTSLFKEEKLIGNGDTLLYRVLYPQNFDKNTSYPLVFFLHGAGERGSDNTKQLTHGSTLFTNEKNRSFFPAIVVMPQCPQDDYWAQVNVDRSNYPIQLDFQFEKGPTKAMGMVISLLEEFKQKRYVNKHQVYLMGLSMGGMGTYELLARKSHTFAAAIPICGAGDPKQVKNYALKTPIWAFHGAKDNVVDPLHSFEMVTALLKEGAFPRFTVYDFANHNSWDPAFSEPDLLPWLFSHQLKK
ncbi:carboxylesterase family protein [Maribacter aquimaris]|nr:dienelactone hydrolase family protein [Maribacter aquimaris]